MEVGLSQAELRVKLPWDVTKNEPLDALKGQYWKLMRYVDDLMNIARGQCLYSLIEII